VTVFVPPIGFFGFGCETGNQILRINRFLHEWRFCA
jgi:hypothetical protein